MLGIQGVATVDGLTWKEVIMGILLPLVLGAYAYAWMSNKGIWAGLASLRQEMKEEMKALRENDIKHLEDRVTRLEDK